MTVMKIFQNVARKQVLDSGAKLRQEVVISSKSFHNSSFNKNTKIITNLLLFLSTIPEQNLI